MSAESVSWDAGARAAVHTPAARMPILRHSGPGSQMGGHSGRAERLTSVIAFHIPILLSHSSSEPPRPRHVYWCGRRGSEEECESKMGMWKAMTALSGLVRGSLANVRR